MLACNGILLSNYFYGSRSKLMLQELTISCQDFEGQRAAASECGLQDNVNRSTSSCYSEGPHSGFICRASQGSESDEEDEDDGDPYLLPITHEVSFEGASGERWTKFTCNTGCANTELNVSQSLVQSSSAHSDTHFQAGR